MSSCQIGWEYFLDDELPWSKQLLPAGWLLRRYVLFSVHFRIGQLVTQQNPWAALVPQLQGAYLGIPPPSHQAVVSLERPPPRACSETRAQLQSLLATKHQALLSPSLNLRSKVPHNSLRVQAVSLCSLRISSLLILRIQSSVNQVHHQVGNLRSSSK